MNKFTRISLGYSCFIKISLIHNQETHIFDWIGSSMWTINDLLQNKFDGMFEKGAIVKKKILANSNQQIFTHTKYYLRFLHDFNNGKNIISDEQFNEFKEKNERRIKRFYELLNNKNNKLLFMRLEEKKEHRIDKYDRLEVDELKLFSKYIQKTYPDLTFMIIHFRYIPNNGYDEENHIITLPVSHDIKVETCKEELNKSMDDNKDFLNNIFE